MTTRAEQVLVLLMESGFLYSVLGVSSLLKSTGCAHAIEQITFLISIMIRLPFGTLGDLYTPTSLQIAVRRPYLLLRSLLNVATLREYTLQLLSSSSVCNGPWTTPITGPRQSFASKHNNYEALNTSVMV